MEFWADEIVAISDGDGQDDNIKVQRDRLRADNRKWLMSRLGARKYGDRIQAEHTGANGGPIEVENMSDKQAAQLLWSMLVSATKGTPEKSGE